ncbi:MAG: very short patch repair endonuclease [Anaerolineales bacterium]|nr:very short patch repair endonuclease [Anaerolineales bacterium]MCW5854630.1 very short patch repair endonuclease [Anaerolineales bacterium]
MTKEQRSRNMSRIRSSMTGFEQKIFKKLKNKRIYFQTHYTRVIGKPDIALPRSRKAVFLHSDFWHGWRLPSWENVLPNEFWINKLRQNRKRDRKVIRKLRQMGWDVFVLWEHSYKKDPDGSIDKIINFLKSDSL